MICFSIRIDKLHLCSGCEKKLRKWTATKELPEKTNEDRISINLNQHDRQILIISIPSTERSFEGGDNVPRNITMVNSIKEAG